MTAPLKDIRVVDFSRVLAGPHCAKTLLDLGADVVKIEPPSGDLSRKAFPNVGDISGYFAQQNAGKRNLSIDLNIQGAREVVVRLCEQADVIVENFRPGTLEVFGLDYATISALNPKVVYASISGYGQSGPWSSRMAYAPTVQAEVGFTRNTTNHFQCEEDNLRSDSLSHADVYSGLHGAIAILAMLNRRAVTGKGGYVDIAMAAVMMSVNERVHYDLSDIDLGAERPILGATDCAFFLNPEGERFVSPMSLVGSLTFPFYLAAMRRPDLADDPRFLTPELRHQNYNVLHGIVQDWILTFDSMASLDAQLDEAKVATGQVREMKELAASEWAQNWPATRTVSDRNGGDYKIPGCPWHFSVDTALDKKEEKDSSDAKHIPAFQGEHNEEILKEIGISSDKIAALSESGALISAAMPLENIQPSISLKIQSKED